MKHPTIIIGSKESSSDETYDDRFSIQEAGGLMIAVENNSHF